MSNSMSLAAAVAVLGLSLAAAHGAAAQNASVMADGTGLVTTIDQFGHATAHLAIVGSRIETSVTQLGDNAHVDLLATGHDVRNVVMTGICPPGTRPLGLALDDSRALNVVILPCR